MSRRSVLLATTFYIAIGSLAAVGPASAHGFGFGGFGGGASFTFRSPAVAYISRAPVQSMGNYDGGRFGHAPAMGSPAAESSSAGVRLQPSRIPAVANAPLGNSPAATPIVRPAQVPQTTTSSGNGILRPSIEAAGIVRPNDSLANQIKDISAVEGRGKLPKSGVNNDVPNVAGPDATIMGQGQSNGGVQKVPGVKIPDGPAVNLPGSQFGQKGPREVPGFGDAANGPQINLPGSVDRHGPDDASKKLSELEQADKQLLNDATKGGPNSLNTSAGLSPGEKESDKYGAESGANGAAASFVNTGRPVQPLVNTGTPVSVWTSKGSDGNGGTVVVTNVSGPNTDRTTIVHTTKDGKTTTKTTSYDPKTSETISSTTTTTGGDGKNNTPNDDSSNSHDIGALSPNSALGKRGEGGGTDNNGTESSGASSGQLANNSSLSRKGHGDGTGDDGGDNNRVGNDGTLAGGTSLARKNYGDGGGSDTRDGGTSLGSPRVPGGGNPGQSNLKAAAAMGD